MAITIKDIANRAGVSRGTVDRVIHNRGNVAPFLKLHIENVITELGYKRNIIASQLVRNKTLNIALVLPHPAEEIYWTLPHLGIEEAVEEYKHLGIKTIPHYFNLVHASSFETTIKQIQWDEIDGVILAPVYKQESLQFLNEYQSYCKPIICINTDLVENFKHTHYVGQDSYQSGFLAGKLFDLSISKNSQISIIRIGKQFEHSEHFTLKEQGLRDYFLQHEKQISIRTIDLNDYSNAHYMRQEISVQLQDKNQDYYFFVPDSKAYRLIEILDKQTLLKSHIIGFDLIAENISELQKGNVAFMINQNPQKQGFVAIKSIVNQIIFDSDIPKKQFVPLDIIVKENIDNINH